MAFPMPEPTTTPLALDQYRVLSFDVYGTLIEYKGHILKSFQPLISRLNPSSPFRNETPLASNSDVPNIASIGSIEFLKLFQREEDKIKLETHSPGTNFGQLLSEIWRRMARELDVHTSEDEALKFGSKDNIASWPVFPGTIEALQILNKHYRLVALSNIDRYAWSITSRSLLSPLGEINWWKMFAAEDFDPDAKKADISKLETLLDFANGNGVEKQEILHIAQSLGHDHAPAKKLGISSVFLIGDGPVWGKESESKMAIEKGLVGYAWRCKDLREFASLVECHFSNKL